MHIRTTSKMPNICRTEIRNHDLQIKTKSITINNYIVLSLCKFITQSVTFEIKRRSVYGKALE